MSILISSTSPLSNDSALTTTSTVNQVIRGIPAEILDRLPAALTKSDVTNHSVCDKFPKLYRGHHVRVFDHRDFPGYVMKQMSLKEAQSRAAAALHCCAVADDYSRLRVPECAWTPLPFDSQETLWIEEKVESLGWGFAFERTDLDFAKLEQRPDLLKAYKELFEQATHFICRTGQGDIDWRNVLLETEPLGLAFIDLENPIEYITPSAMVHGISRLLKMAPPQVMPDMMAVASRYGVTEQTSTTYDTKNVFETFDSACYTLNDCMTKRRGDLDFNHRFRGWLAEHNVTSSDQPVITTNRKLSKTEQETVDELNRKREEGLKYGSFDFHKGSLVRQRETHWQAYSGKINLWRPSGWGTLDFQERKAAVAPLKEQIETALNRMIEENEIFAWTSKETDDPVCEMYKIYS